jgi:ubiquinone/menaquinone biosynthesis C-methylase UbiE
VSAGPAGGFQDRRDGRDQHEAVREYFDRAAVHWDEKVSVDPDRIRGVLAHARLGRGDAVLDVGAGTGVLLPFLLEVVGPAGEVFALDISPAMLARARSKGFRGVQYLCAPAEDIPLPDESCEAVICYSAFPHFTDKERAMTEMGRVLAPGGRLVIAHADSRQAVNELHASLRGTVAGHRLPEDATMRGFLETAGLEEVLLADEPGRYLLVAAKPAHRGAVV